MKPLLLSPLLFAILAMLPAQAQTSSPIPDQLPRDVGSAVEAAKALAPGVVEKAESKLEDATAKGLPTAAAAASTGAASPAKPKGSTRSATRNAADPAGWGPDEVHKLAVMDLKFGKETRTVMFELFPSDAPKTVAAFSANADSNLYNGLAIHRAIDSYLVQTGDPQTADEDARDKWGTGGQDRLPAEIKRSHKLGAVAMARRGDKVNPERKSNDSQFYFVLGNMTGLDGQYTVFGQVVSG
jgi:cyclophilin family peptidyl-prolyl cis-trans isomerase